MKKSILFLATLLCTLAASATVINGTPNPGEYGRVRYWVHTAANPGDTILLADGTYDEQSVINFNKEGIVVMAKEGATPIIKTKGQWMIMNITATTTFEGITFESDDSDRDKYAFNDSANATFRNCTFKDFTDYIIKAVGTNGTESLVVEDCVFDGEGVTPTAILIEGNALVTCQNSTFTNHVDYSISVESGANTSLTIDGCEFDGANTTKAAIFSKGIVSSCDIQDTEFKNMAEHAITVDKWYYGRYDELTINNTLIHDCAKSAIYLPYAKDDNEKQTCSNFKLTNSTIYNIDDGEYEEDESSYATIEIRDNANIASKQEVLIDHVTIYNFLNSGYCGAIRVEKSADAVVSNSIVMNTEQKWANPYRLFTGAQIINSLYYNTEYVDNGATYEAPIYSDPMFVDAANGNFQLYAESPAVGAGTDGSNLGDPRWGVKAGIQAGDGKLKAAVDAAQPGDVIVLGDETYEVSSSIYCNKEGLKIVAAEGTKPVISITNAWASFKLSATITFEGVTFDGNNLANYPVLSSGTEASTYTFNNCEFKNYLYYAISNPYEGGTYVESVIINNCLFHDGGAAVCFNKKGYNENAACNSLKITNSTIYNVSCSEWVGIIHVASNEEATGMQNEVIIDHITMYNFTPNELGGFTSRMSENAQITNSIIANPADNANQYAFRIYGAAEAKNVLYYNTKIEGNNSGCIKEDPLFVDAANGNFDLYANSLAVNAGTDGKTLGDPRWDVSEKTISTGKRIYVTPDEDLRYYVITDPNVKVGDTLVLANGTYNISSTTEFSKEGLVVMADENAKPEIKLTDTGGYASLKLNNGTTFDGITFNGTGISNYLVIANGTDASKFVFNNCEFKNYVYYAISDPWTDKYENGTHVDSILINNCLFHDGGAAINLSKYGPDGKHTCDYFEMKNSTIYNISNTGNAAILVSSNDENGGVQNKVVLDHITMYNYANASYGAIAIRKSSDLQITNSIIANPASGLYAFYIYGGTINNTLYYNATYDSDATYTACITEDPLFVDAANGNFKLKANSPAIGKATDGSHLGDPRWGVEEPELITLTTGDNDAVIAANIGKTVNVKIERSFTANDGYYTLCVPFNMPASVIGKAYSLGTITKHVTGEGININLKEENELSAGMPYLVLPKANMSELVVENVTIAEDGVAGQGVSNDELNVQIFFQGYYSAGGQTNGLTEYYVGDKGYLYNEVVDIRGLCGLFTITDTEGNPTKVRARVVTREDAATGLDNNQLPITNIQKAIENGQLIIIRDGVKYNVQGQVIK